VIVVRRIAPVLISVVLTLSTLACIGVCDMFAPSPWEITHGYYLLNDEFGVSIHTRSGRSTYPYVVRSDVIDLDWNSEFIVVKQNPREELGEPDTGGRQLVYHRCCESGDIRSLYVCGVYSRESQAVSL
jgi:hypothetical protein